MKISKHPILPIFIWLIFCLPGFLMAQQWIDKKYDYDSTLNVFYGTATDFNQGVDSLEMDIYLPICDDPTQTSRRPLLIWIHGGAFISGSKDEANITYLAKAFAQRGYVTASINYRLGFVSDELAWNCNYPNYSCVFATDEEEWVRAWYRGVQDTKGAIRFLLAQHDQLRIDTSNVFLAGESAGGFLALGAALLDTAAERPAATYQLADAPKPNPNTLACGHNVGQSFLADSVARPDLGGIDGAIALQAPSFRVKGVGNMFGGLMTNLLALRPAQAVPPAIYSFHQPCDLIVPIDSGAVFQGLTWCFTNGYNCYGISNTPQIYGSRAISDLNTAHAYGYTIQNDFTNVNFPYNFALGQASCLDQVNNPCHAYANRNLRESNLAAFFAPLVTTSPVCDTTLTGLHTDLAERLLHIQPNPARDVFRVSYPSRTAWSVEIFDLQGRQMAAFPPAARPHLDVQTGNWPAGVYLLSIRDAAGNRLHRRVLKQ